MRRIWLTLLVLLSAAPLYAQSENTVGPRILTATGTVSIDVKNKGTVSVDVRGTYTGTVSFQVSAGGGDFAAVDCAAPSTPGTDVNSTTGVGVWSCNVAGYQVFHASYAHTSGSPTILLHAVGTGGGGGSGAGATDGVTQGSTTSGQSGPLAQGAVTTSAPSYTTAQTSPLSLSTAGALRVTDELAEQNLNDILSASQATATDIAYIRANLAVNSTVDNLAQTTGGQAMLYAQDFDGAALPGVVSAETDAVRAAASLYGVQYFMPTNEDGSLTPLGVEDLGETVSSVLMMAGSVRRDVAAASAGTTGDNATLNTDALGRVWTRRGDPCSDHARLSSAAISESTAATNQIVALSGSNLIYVCSYKWVTTLADSLSWAYGTGSDCATGLTAIEGAQPYAANGGVAENAGGAPLFVVPAGNALCLTSSAATAHGGRVTYVSTAAP